MFSIYKEDMYTIIYLLDIMCEKWEGDGYGLYSIIIYKSSYLTGFDGNGGVIEAPAEYSFAIRCHLIFLSAFIRSLFCSSKTLYALFRESTIFVSFDFRTSIVLKCRIFRLVSIYIIRFPFSYKMSLPPLKKLNYVEI